MEGKTQNDEIIDEHVAIERGYTKPVKLEGNWYALDLLVKPNTDMDGPFVGFDRCEKELLRVNGWLFSEVTDEHSDF